MSLNPPIDNWQGKLFSPKLKRDGFELYSGSLSSFPMTKMKSKIKKNQFYAVIECEDGLLSLKKTKVVEVGKKHLEA